MVVPFHFIEDHGGHGMNVLIVDDEPLAREGMKLLLKDEAAVASIAEARNGAEAVETIRSQRPDLVLLDVQMPEMDGFGVLRAIGAEHMPPVIFVTAHDRYAIQAFEVNAIDYLLKPVTRERCSQALARVRERLGEGGDNRHVMSLLQQLAAPPQYLARVALRSAGKVSFVNIEDILFVQAAENYVQLHLKNARHLLHVPIATFEELARPAAVPAHPSLVDRQRQTRARARDRAAWRVHRGVARRDAAAVEPQLPREDQEVGVEPLLARPAAISAIDRADEYHVREQRAPEAPQAGRVVPHGRERDHDEIHHDEQHQAVERAHERGLRDQYGQPAAGAHIDQRHDEGDEEMQQQAERGGGVAAGVGVEP